MYYSEIPDQPECLSKFLCISNHRMNEQKELRLTLHGDADGLAFN
jgi:hypothetical protein